MGWTNNLTSEHLCYTNKSLLHPSQERDYSTSFLTFCLFPFLFEVSLSLFPYPLLFDPFPLSVVLYLPPVCPPSVIYHFLIFAKPSLSHYSLLHLFRPCVSGSISHHIISQCVSLFIPFFPVLLIMSSLFLLVFFCFSFVLDLDFYSSCVCFSNYILRFL